ncbi:MAG: class II glutamine amidotransferase [Labilithrix sp.]|nr:class II glutamine amidotransferase [Labilithrix sp.]
MCRLVGIVASEITEFGLVLKEAPRSLARLSREHPDGWGVAAHGGPDSIPPPSERSPHDGVWRIHKGTNPAGECDRFLDVASRSAGTVLIAHVRQKTVGPTSIENTHPFVQSGWVFAHNGTLVDHGSLRAATSARRLAEVRGNTDSEALFAFLLTRLDEAGVSRVGGCGTARQEATRVVARAAEELRARKAGAFNFLLSDGVSCFVHRFGRSLFLLERTPSEPGRARDAGAEGAPPPAPWTPRRHAVLVASERLTEEPWRELPEGTLLRIDRGPAPTILWADAPERAAS